MNWTPNTPYLVIVNYYDNDVSWSNRLQMPHIIYYKERPEKAPFTAINKAKSETNLLKFVVDFYDQLPQNVIIVHQYERKFHHEVSLIDILNDPTFEDQYKNSLTKGFWSFNSYIPGSVITQIDRMMKSGWWSATMEPWFGPIESCGNFTFGKKGCAQFVVSRDRIRSLPRKFYENIYNWLVTNSLDETPTAFNPQTLTRVNSPTWNHPNSSCYTSRYMEWSWELIFTSYKK